VSGIILGSQKKDGWFDQVLVLRGHIIICSSFVKEELQGSYSNVEEVDQVVTFEARTSTQAWRASELCCETREQDQESSDNVLILLSAVQAVVYFLAASPASRPNDLSLECRELHHSRI
jgi:hypothetical protein